MSTPAQLRRPLFSLMSLSLFLTTGQAAQVSLGLQTSIGRTVSGGQRALFGLGAHLTVSTPINAAQDVQVRGNLEGNLELSGAPNILLDVTLIKQNPGIYYGGGIGSGVSFGYIENNVGIPSSLVSALSLLNIHGVVGTTLSNGTTVEGLLRIGGAPRLEARVSFPLR